MEKKKKKSSFWKVFGAALVALVLLINTMLILSMWQSVKRVDRYNLGVVDEIGGVSGNVKQFADDLNEIREFLLLPKREYFEEEEQGGDSGQEANSTSTKGIYLFLADYQKEHNLLKNSQKAKDLLVAWKKSGVLSSRLKENGLFWGDEQSSTVNNNIKVKNNLNTNIFNLVFDYSTGKVIVQSALEEKEIFTFENADETTLADYFLANKETVTKRKTDLQKKEEDLENLMRDKAVQEALKAKNLVVVEGFKEEQGAYQKEIKENNRVVLTLTINKSNLKYVLNQVQFDEVAPLKEELIKVLANLDLRTEEQKDFELRKEEFQRLLNEPAFKDLISSMGLTIKGPRDESNKLVYDLIDEKGVVKFSLALEISSGHFKLIQNNKEIDLENYQIDDGSKKNF